MKTNSKFLAGALAFTFAFSALVSVPVYAHNGEDDDATHSEDTQKISQVSKSSVFCKSFDALTTKTVSEVSKRDGSTRTKWQKSITDIQAKREEWKSKVAAARAEAATKREANFAKLDAVAQTDEQKAAVATYKSAVLAAVATRQAAYDANFEAYFTGVAALIASQKTNTSGDAATFKASVSAAVEKAKSSCASGASADTVKKQLSADLKAARDAFKKSFSGDKTSFKSQLEALKKTRKEANEKARETFKSALETARTDLKAAFPSTDDSV